MVDSGYTVKIFKMEDLYDPSDCGDIMQIAILEWLESLSNAPDDLPEAFEEHRLDIR